MNAWHDFVKTDDYRARLNTIPQRQELLIHDAGHMLHHDQSEALARGIMAFLD